MTAKGARSFLVTLTAGKGLSADHRIAPFAPAKVARVRKVRKPADADRIVGIPSESFFACGLRKTAKGARSFLVTLTAGKGLSADHRIAPFPAAKVARVRPEFVEYAFLPDDYEAYL